MPEEFLYHPDVISIFKQMRCKTVTQGMNRKSVISFLMGNVLLHLRKALSPLVPIEGIEGALRSVFHITQHMGVDHGRFDILVSQKGLDFTDVDAVHQEMRRKAVPEGMNRCMFSNTGLLHSFPDSELDRLVANMVRRHYAEFRIMPSVGLFGLSIRGLAISHSA